MPGRAKAALADLGLLDESAEETKCTFQQYADKWLDEYAEIELKPHPS